MRAPQILSVLVFDSYNNNTILFNSSKVELSFFDKLMRRKKPTNYAGLIPTLSLVVKSNTRQEITYEGIKIYCVHRFDGIFSVIITEQEYEFDRHMLFPRYIAKQASELKEKGLKIDLNKEIQNYNSGRLTFPKYVIYDKTYELMDSMVFRLEMYLGRGKKLQDLIDESYNIAEEVRYYR